MPSSPLIPIVLAGGRSSRMVENKCFLKVNGITWLEQALATLKNIGSPAVSVLISGDVEGYACVPDIETGRGPLMGLFSVMSHLWNTTQREAWLLVVPVDMPLLQQGVLKELTEQIEKTKAQAIIFENYPLPLVLKFDEAMMATMRSMLAENDSRNSFRQLLMTVAVEELPVSRERCFYNFNYPSDLEVL